MDDLTELSIPKLLRTYGDILDELRRRRIVRSANNPVADFAELMAAQGLGLTLMGMSVAGYDAKDSNGLRYQVEADGLHVRTHPVS